MHQRVIPLHPGPPTAFLGREREVCEVTALLGQADARLVTLIGPGGVGKTRLAQVVARASPFPVVVTVALAAVRDPAFVLPAIALALGLRETASESLLAQIADVADAESWLLLLDNCEHLLEAAPRVSELLAKCSGLSVLATSRSALRLTGEQRYPVLPLSLPPAGAQDARRALTSAAVQLFVARAAAALPAFALDDANAAAVAAICTRLEGLPLAIELAAARMPVLSPLQLETRLDQQLQLLTGGPRDAPARLQTMEAAIAWSYDLLVPGEQQLFRRLAVFAGGFTLEAAEAVSWEPTPGAGAFLDRFTTLVEHHLVRLESKIGSAPRFSMLEPIREFAAERLQDADEDAAARQRHADWFLDIVERNAPDPPLPGHQTRSTALAVEYDNVRLALAWFTAMDAGPKLLRLTGALFEFWYATGRYAEGRAWLDEALRYRNGPPAGRLRALGTAGALAHIQGDMPALAAVVAEELPLAQVVGDPARLVVARFNAALLASLLRDPDHATAHMEQALALLREMGDEAPGAAPLVGVALANLGNFALAAHAFPEAARRYDEAIPILRATGADWGLADAITGRAHVLQARGAHPAAAACLMEALELAARVSDPRFVAAALFAAASVALSATQVTGALQLLGAAEHTARQIGASLSDVEQAVHDRGLAVAQGQLGAMTTRRELAAGRAMTLPEAVTVAQTMLAGVAGPGPASGPARALGLSARELEVLQLLVAGQTDRDIAAALFISRKTASNHVSHILSKLGVENRAAAVARALKLLRG